MYIYIYICINVMVVHISRHSNSTNTYAWKIKYFDIIIYFCRMGNRGVFLITSIWSESNLQMCSLMRVCILTIITQPALYWVAYTQFFYIHVHRTISNWMRTVNCCRSTLANPMNSQTTIIIVLAVWLYICLSVRLSICLYVWMCMDDREGD